MEFTGLQSEADPVERANAGEFLDDVLHFEKGHREMCPRFGGAIFGTDKLTK
jgi:hypothetical protein